MFGQGYARLLDVEELLGLAGLVVGEALLAAHALGLFPEHQAHGAAAGALIDVEGLLAGEVEEQVALSGAAAEHDLYGVHAAGVVLADADDLLVLGAADVQQLDGVERGLVADGESAALVAVEFGAVGPGFDLHVLPPII